MTTDLYKTVLFNDGEGLTHTDFNDSQRFLAARFYDGMLEKLVPGLATSGSPIKGDLELSGENGTDVSTKYAYCLNPGQAYLVKGSGNNKIKLTAGTLFQKVGTAAGDEPTFLSFTFTGSNADEITLANGNASNPRVDILQMKLEYVTADSQSRDFEDGTSHVITTTTPFKKRRVQCTLSLKQGTAAATPAYPMPDAGYVIVAAFYVVTLETWTNAIWPLVVAGSYIHDHRMPMRVTAYVVGAYDFVNELNCAVNTGNSNLEFSNATNKSYALCPVNNGRLLGVGYSMAGYVAGTIFLGKAQYPTNTHAVIASGTRNTLAAPLSTDLAISHFTTFQASPTDAAVTANADGFGPPVWCNGHRAIVERYGAMQPFYNKLDQLAIGFTNFTMGSGIGAVVFYVAEGI